LSKEYRETRPGLGSDEIHLIPFPFLAAEMRKVNKQKNNEIKLEKMKYFMYGGRQ
jgi:hypothetical protein